LSHQPRRRAVAALRPDAFFRERSGGDLISYLRTVDDADIARFRAGVTEWEHREHFEMF
jgi:hypothetical protein